MKQASLKLNLNVKKTRKQVFLEQMAQVVPWAALVELIAPYDPEGKTGRPPFSLQTMLRVHFMQQWFTLSDPGMQEAFFDTAGIKSNAALQAELDLSRGQVRDLQKRVFASKSERRIIIFSAYSTEPLRSLPISATRHPPSPKTTHQVGVNHYKSAFVN